MLATRWLTKIEVAILILTGGVPASLQIDQVDDRIGTAHAVTRRLASLTT